MIGANRHGWCDEHEFEDEISMNTNSQMITEKKRENRTTKNDALFI